MGLTIHYQLRLVRTDDGREDAHGRWAAEALRKLALKFKRQGRLDTVGKLGIGPEERRYAVEWRTRPVPGRPHAFTDEEIRPVAGQIFRVGVGRGCEPLWLGLCRYPRGRWRLQGFCKTQYAGLLGWEHFRRCHTAVIDLLSAAAAAGCKVAISDEGEYWPRRSVKRLRENLDQMNSAVAAVAGGFKDAGEAEDRKAVRSPILCHPQFERLEAEGAARGYASRLRTALRGSQCHEGEGAESLAGEE